MNQIADSFQTLFSHAKKHLSLDELDTISNLAEEAGQEAGRLSHVCSALACIVGSDRQSSIPSGSFQDASSVFDLLCGLSLSLDAISGMVIVGHRAEDLAHELREKGGTDMVKKP